MILNEPHCTLVGENAVFTAIAVILLIAGSAPRRTTSFVIHGQSLSLRSGNDNGNS
jgi:hypothetical protein